MPKLMNPNFSRGSLRTADRRRTVAAFSIPESMVALTLFVLLLMSVLYIHMFGLRWFSITQTKLLASDYARLSMGKMTDDIRGCSSVFVGGVTNGTFTAAATGTAMTGNGLLLYPGTNSSNYIMYFFNAPDQTFRRTVSSTSSTTVIAKCVTNYAIFQEQDCLGNVLSNSQQNFVIHCSLILYSASTTNPAASYYKLETSVNPRLID